MDDTVVTALVEHWKLAAGGGGLGITGMVLLSIIKRQIRRHDELKEQVEDMRANMASREELNKSIASLRREFSERTNEVKQEISATRRDIRQDLGAINNTITQQLSQAIEIVKIIKRD